MPQHWRSKPPQPSSHLSDALAALGWLLFLAAAGLLLMGLDWLHQNGLLTIP